MQASNLSFSVWVAFSLERDFIVYVMLSLEFRTINGSMEIGIVIGEIANEI